MFLELRPHGGRGIADMRELSFGLRWHSQPRSDWTIRVVMRIPQANDICGARMEEGGPRARCPCPHIFSPPRPHSPLFRQCAPPAPRNGCLVAIALYGGAASPYSSNASLDERWAAASSPPAAVSCARSSDAFPRLPPTSLYLLLGCQLDSCIPLSALCQLFPAPLHDVLHLLAFVSPASQPCSERRAPPAFAVIEHKTSPECVGARPPNCFPHLGPPLVCGWYEQGASAVMRLPCGRGGGGSTLITPDGSCTSPHSGSAPALRPYKPQAGLPPSSRPYRSRPHRISTLPHSPSFNLFPLFPCLLHTVLLLLLARGDTVPHGTPRKDSEEWKRAYLCTQITASSAAPLSGAAPFSGRAVLVAVVGIL
ncbi:hypothetical protein B0H13DRAFT_2663366 [Mycena leptocephala]|nr:hypothetical protein B0H13DRAFT_2663366 [Mycena leptocephala]